MKKILNHILLVFLITCGCNVNRSGNDGDTSNIRIFRLVEMNTQQIQSLSKSEAIVILVGGILEEHGPYLPTFTDGFWNERFADTLASILQARTNRDVILFPTIPLGNSGANDIGLKYSFPGTYSVRFETMRGIFMDLAIELGEQGFRNIVIVHGHGAPNHQRALDHASDFFNDIYKGQMVNLFGYAKIQDEWFNVQKTEEEALQDGIKMHGGMDETSAILFLREDLVRKEYKTAKPFPGSDMKGLLEISSKNDWPGYFGSEASATVELGREAWNKNVNDFSDFIISIIEGNINLDTVRRFGDIATSPEDRMLDSLSLNEEARRRKMQIDWLKEKSLID